ncbi:ADP-ribosylation factor-like protein 9 [Parambassis ranga]|uniref:ADP-ribosylation factor-like protein 9 n=1 Tax=Parambassis ranga TaxID=210632 RepID=A0A6P7J6Y1_9TELE|nr:ADP-ribosylation factor-like protein 9 [Parambassis ranga]
MVGLRKAGVLGGSVILAGGVAYLIWKYASSSGQTETETRQKEKEEKEEEEEEEEEKEQRTVEASAEQTLSAVEAQKTSEARPVASGGTHILVLGLDGAGKTSLMHCLASSSLEHDLKPTVGFNAVSINREDLHIEFLEIGGRADLRPYWQRYMSKALLLVFVVDSSDPELFPVAKKHLHELLASRPDLPLMVLANKQDLPGSCGITDLHDALSLSEVGDRRLFLIGTHVKKGEAQLSSGVQDAQELIIQMVCEGR